MPAGRKTGFLASALTLAAGSTTSQVITLALMPIITRLYGPEVFGVFAVFVAIATVLISVANLQFAEVIVVARTRADADSAALVATSIVAMVSLVSAICVWLFADNIASLLGIAAYGFLLQFLAVSVFLGGVRQVMRRWLLREHFNRHIALAEVSNALADRCATIALAWFAPGTPVGLVVGRIVGQCAALVSMASPLLSRKSHVRLSKSQFLASRSLFSEYSHFPRYSWAVLVDNAAQQLPVILINAFLGPTVAGGFALARRVLAEPAIILGAAVAQSFYQRAARADKDALRELTADMTLALIKLLVLPIIIGLGCAPELFATVFGEAWRVTGWYALLLAPAFMLYFLLRPLNRIFDVTGMQKEKGVYALQNLAVIGIALSSALFTENAFVVLGIYSGFTTLFLAYRCLWILSKVGVSGVELTKSLAWSFFLALASVATVLFMRLMLEFQTWDSFLAVGTVTLLYLISLVLVDRPLREMLSTLLGRLR